MNESGEHVERRALLRTLGVGQQRLALPSWVASRTPARPPRTTAIP